MLLLDFATLYPVIILVNEERKNLGEVMLITTLLDSRQVVLHWSNLKVYIL